MTKRPTMPWFAEPIPAPPSPLSNYRLRRLVALGFETRALQLWAGTCPRCNRNRASLTPRPCHDTQDVLDLRLAIHPDNDPKGRPVRRRRNPGPGVRRPLPQSQKRVDDTVVVRFVDPADLRKDSLAA